MGQRDRARKTSEARSPLTGRVVGSHINSMTVKLFARAEQEDAFMREAPERLNHDVGRQTRLVTRNALLHRAIRDNIRCGRPAAADAGVEQAARRAEAHDVIAALSDWRGRAGYDAHRGERGVKLSGGQRQRSAIARVLLQDAPILVLDEATSALDPEAEAVIQDSLARLMESKTVIGVAHRLSTLARMDRLVVLDHGRVAEQGTRAERRAAGGIHARLRARQSGGCIGD